MLRFSVEGLHGYFVLYFLSACIYYSHRPRDRAGSRGAEGEDEVTDVTFYTENFTYPSTRPDLTRPGPKGLGPYSKHAIARAIG